MNNEVDKLIKNGLTHDLFGDGQQQLNSSFGCRIGCRMHVKKPIKIEAYSKGKEKRSA